MSGPVLSKLVPTGTSNLAVGSERRRRRARQGAAAREAGVDYLLLAELDMWTAEELAAAVSEARLRGLPVHAYAERPADVERGAAAQFDGFLGTGMGAGPFPAEVILSLNGGSRRRVRGRSPGRRRSRRCSTSSH